MSENTEKRDRVRALVKQVLDSVQSEKQPQTNYPERVRVNSLKDPDIEFDRDESAKPLLTEDDLRGLDEGSKVRIGKDARLTPSAMDFVKDKQIELLRKEPRGDTIMVNTVGIGCDHGGYELKERLKVYLGDHALQVRDFGTNSTDAVDYPDFAHAVAEAVSKGHVDIGIIIDGAGIGSAMAAGKVPGVRPAACYSGVLARNSREHNGANVLTLGSGQNTYEEATEIVYAFITTEISEPRHKKRVGKIDAIERQYRNSE